MYLRVLISAILGFLIGWDRESKSKPAGIKTYMYVCVASTLITLISIYSVDEFSTMSDTIRMDPMRLTAQIVAGLGFLGGGVIIKDGVQVKGLTSAAMILLAGGVGIGIGAGFYGIVSFAVIISLVLAKLGNHMESRKMARLEREMNKNEVHL
ncbi:MgtC/SapB family protein [Fictibacillus sp. 23RED33]|uniref:MgtC/SapB family protein n=1 Tax=Fictibacillus sp. 23RED33 TaxID=2745879 RepID=UPI0018CD3AD5|nr:MgtC/SapB family protein [Fictibacillus sp. 23RED33]MBH0173663.1 MgtC/SapB family protein [Fictibacillus sp. 23RED33]